MKVTLKLTMDGLLRAMRTRADRLAEEIEAGRMLPERARPGRGAATGRPAAAEGNGHDRSG